MRNKICKILSLCLIICTLLSVFTACHTHNFNQQIATETFIASDANCKEKAKYYYSCSCGEIGLKTFEHGEILAHVCKDGQCVWCQEKVSTGLAYKLINNNEYKVIDVGTCMDTAVYIPSTYKGLPVTAIGDEAFSNNPLITSVEIPNGVKSMGSSVFWGCSFLKRIVIPDSLTDFKPTSCFSYCPSLETIIVGSGNPKFHSNGNCLIETATNTLVLGCSTCVIPEYVHTIGDKAFHGCSSLVSITIPAHITTIGFSVFSFCSSLKSVIIPDSVTTIRSNIFRGSFSLKTIYCEASMQPSGWDTYWKSEDTEWSCPAEVIWGYKGN